MLVYLEATVNLLFSLGEKVKVDDLVKNGEVKQIEIEGKEIIKYLKITDEKSLV
jgi:hypothetical protein